MKIELKKIKINLTFSEETTMFQADLVINGVVVGHASNEGRGGNTDYRVVTYDTKKLTPLPFSELERNRLLIKEAEAYCKSLPPIKVSDDFTLDMDLENFIDELVEAEIERKEQKKLEKKMENYLMWGKPNALSYTQLKLKVPLSKLPLIQLQGYVNKYKEQFKNGEVFLNTNLESLGVKI